MIWSKSKYTFYLKKNFFPKNISFVTWCGETW